MICDCFMDLVAHPDPSCFLTSTCPSPHLPCTVLLTTESRDALWCFYKHISNGLSAAKFRPVVEEEPAPVQPRPTAGAPANPGFDRMESSDLGGMALPHTYGVLSEPASPRDESTAQNELLRLLLNQDQQMEEGPASMSRIK